MQTTLNYNINFELRFLQFLTKTYNTVKFIAGLIGIILLTLLLLPVLLPVNILYLNINNKRRLERYKTIFAKSSEDEKIYTYIFLLDIYLFFKNEKVENFFLWRNYFKMIKELLEYIENNYSTLIIQNLLIDEHKTDNKAILTDKNNITDYLLEISPIKNNEAYIASHTILDDWNDPENDHWDNY